MQQVNKDFVKQYKQNVREVMQGYETRLNYYQNKISEAAKLSNELAAFIDELGDKDTKTAQKAISKQIELKEASKLACENIEYFKASIKRLTRMMLSLSSEGFQRPVYGLPELCLTYSKDDISLEYLKLKGIKMNGTSDLDYEYPDYFQDEAFHNYECKLASMIGDDYKVPVDKMETFLNFYISYLNRYQAVTAKLLMRHVGTVIDQETAKKCGNETYMAVCSFILYQICLHTGMDEFDQDFEDFIDNYEVKDGLKNTMINLFNSAIKEFEEKQKEKKKKSVKDVNPPTESTAETEEKNSTNSAKPIKELNSKVQERNPLNDYISKGVVYRDCDLEEFKVLLDQSDLSVDRKNEYYAQMRNRKNRKLREVYEARLLEVKNSYLGKDNLALYEKYKNNPACKFIIEDIDTALEMLVVEQDEDNIALLYEEILSSIDLLRAMFEGTIETVPSPENNKTFK